LLTAGRLDAEQVFTVIQRYVSSAWLPLHWHERVRSSRQCAVTGRQLDWQTGAPALGRLLLRFPRSRTPTEDATWRHRAALERAGVDRAAEGHSHHAADSQTGSKSKQCACAVDPTRRSRPASRANGPFQQTSHSGSTVRRSFRLCEKWYRAYNCRHVFVTNGHAARPLYRFRMLSYHEENTFSRLRCPRFGVFSASVKKPTFCCRATLTRPVKLEYYRKASNFFAALYFFIDGDNATIGVTIPSTRCRIWVATFEKVANRDAKYTTRVVGKNCDFPSMPLPSHISETVYCAWNVNRKLYVLYQIRWHCRRPCLTL